jgi:hypothetical protein
MALAPMSTTATGTGGSEDGDAAAGGAAATACGFNVRSRAPMASF